MVSIPEVFIIICAHGLLARYVISYFRIVNLLLEVDFLGIGLYKGNITDIGTLLGTVMLIVLLLDIRLEISVAGYYAGYSGI